MRHHHCHVVSEGEGRVHMVITSWERMRCGHENEDAVVVACEGGWVRHHHHLLSMLRHGSSVRERERARVQE